MLAVSETAAKPCWEGDANQDAEYGGTCCAFQLSNGRDATLAVPRTQRGLPSLIFAVCAHTFAMPTRYV